LFEIVGKKNFIFFGIQSGTKGAFGFQSKKMNFCFVFLLMLLLSSCSAETGLSKEDLEVLQELREGIVEEVGLF
jgi:hypothetical protein